MNKRYNLKLDLQFRCNNSTMKFNQFDNNTSDFFMRITNGGKLVDIEKAIVVLATIKPSGKVTSQFVEIENGLVYADLKPNMRDEIGIYTAQAMLILEDERVVTDVISYKVEEDKIFSLLNDTVEDTEDFTLLTDMLSRLSTIEISEEQRVINEAERILSEENRKIEEAKRVEAELIRQHEEADRTKYDATRESNENIRKQNESIRLANETNRIDEEAKRVEEEAKRVEAEQLRKDNYNFMTEDEERRRLEANAHKEAEKLRAQAEINRVNEEAKRRTTEQARVSAENTRVSNENTRKANETTRQTNETHRVEAETQRQNRYNSFILDAEANANNFENYTNTAKVKEEERKSNELDRKSQEDRRVSNEVERISNENTRKANEVAREKNETTRQNVFENKVNEVDKKIIEINTTKDNFVSSISTKVDNKISEIDNVKDNFVSSVNTKVDSKISELNTAKSDMTNTVANKVNEVENRFNALTSKQQQDAEVIDARDGETSLKARLDRDIEKAKQVYVNVEGNHISTDSSVGYLKDIEILGNTIQSASNLADIRSVGDKVEGQELYEIPVLSVGKNLFNTKKAVSTTGVSGISVVATNSDMILTATSGAYNMLPINYNLKPNTKYILKGSHTVLNGKGRPYCEIRDINGVLLGSNGWKLPIQFTTDNTGFVKILFGCNDNENNASIRYYNIQLEEGTVATPYEPYQEDKLTILSPTPLEKVGDVRDRLIEKDGVWGVEKNNIDLDINKATIKSLLTTDVNTIRVYLEFDNVIDIPVGDSVSILCNYLPSKTVFALDEEGIFIASQKDNAIILRVDKSKFNDDYTKDNILSVLKSSIEFIKVNAKTSTFIPLPHDQQIKLRTFAGKTNISFLTEIEGTIKAQVPKSLGATVNVHTEQINNLNKELDRVKKLEESTVSTVTTESEFTTVEATSNGYFEDVKLEGKTLVNLSNLTGGDITIYRSIGDGKIVPLRQLTSSDTLYLTFNCTSINSDANLGIIYSVAYKDGTSTEYKTIENDKIVGHKKIKIIPKSDVQHIAIFLHGDNSSSARATISDVMLMYEKDYDVQNPPSYFEGLKSVGQSATTSEQDVDEIVVESANNGFIDCSSIMINGNINSNTGANNNDTSAISSSEFIRVVPNRQYVVSNSLYSNCRFFYYTKDKEYLGCSDTNTSTITTPNRCYFIKVRVIGTDLNSITIIKAVGGIDREYTSDKKRLLYYNTETQTWENPILRQWDSIEKHANGKYYYHVRSIEEDYVEGDEIVTDYITDMTTTVKPLSQEKIYECTNIDLITYNGETNYIVESGAIVPKTTLKVHNNISNVVSLLQKKVSLLESDVTSYMITQNRLMLASRYNADNVTFKVDYPSMMSEREVEIDYDLFKLIQDNIIVGPENYDVDKMLEIMDLYAMIGFITWEMWDYLYEVIDSQINPVIGDLEGAPEI